LAVVEHRLAGAEAARDVVGLPGPESDLVDAREARDLQRRIPERAFLVPELGSDRRQRLVAIGDPAVIARSVQPEIQLQWIGGHGLAERQRAEEDAEQGGKAE